jgi:hypothetical protein
MEQLPPANCSLVRSTNVSVSVMSNGEISVETYCEIFL